MIEHGILRRSKIKLSLGYLNKPFPKEIEKKLRVEELDYRIHFALNCGAKSCPAIASYNATQIDDQLELSTHSYLSQEVEIKNNEVWIPKLFLWFKNDFGRKKGTYKILNKYKLIEPNSKPKIHYKEYNWDIYLNHYKF